MSRMFRAIARSPLALAVAQGGFGSRRTGEPLTVRQAALWAGVWLVVGVGASGVLWASSGGAVAGQYLGGYLVERVLSVDNLAVLFVLLGAAGIPEAARRRALNWGLAGAFLLRSVLLVAGAAVLEAVPLVAVLFGLGLVAAGARLWRGSGRHPEGNGRLQAAAAQLLPMTPRYEGRSLWIRKDGRRLATPLVGLIAAVAVTDLVFALDAVPAVLSFAPVPWVAVTANALALLGLQSLYWLVGDLVSRLRHLRTGLAGVLALAGVRLTLEPFLSLPLGADLGAMAAVMAVAVIASLRVPATERHPRVMAEAVPDTGQRRSP